MLECLVVVTPSDSEMGRSRDYSINHRGMQGHAFPLPIKGLNKHGDDYQMVEAWHVAHADAEVFVAELSKKFPGRDINVLTLNTVFSRAVGDLKSKVVSKDGVLPF